MKCAKDNYYTLGISYKELVYGFIYVLTAFASVRPLIFRPLIYCDDGDGNGGDDDVHHDGRSNDSTEVQHG